MKTASTYGQVIKDIYHNILKWQKGQRCSSAVQCLLGKTQDPEFDFKYPSPSKKRKKSSYTEGQNGLLSIN